MEDQTLEGTETIQTPEETVEKETLETKPVDYETKFKASQTEAIKLRKELDELKKSKETTVIPEDEKKLRDVILKIEKEKIEQEKQEEEQLQKDLDSLKEVYGEFDKKRLLEIVDRYGVYKEDNTVNWDRGMELYQNLSKIPEAPKKIPSGKRESVQPLEVDTKPDVSSKSMNQLVQEGLKKFGL